jgi:hypothetical protein
VSNEEIGVTTMQVQYFLIWVVNTVYIWSINKIMSFLCLQITSMDLFGIMLSWPIIPQLRLRRLQFFVNVYMNAKNRSGGTSMLLVCTILHYIIELPNDDIPSP